MTNKADRSGMQVLRFAHLTLLVAVLLATSFASLACSPQPAPAPLPAPPQPPKEQPLLGEMFVNVRPPGTLETVTVDQAGALPARAGGKMKLQVKVNQPVYLYLVWLDCEGRAVPLYPWNTEILDITDINESPPVRRASQVVESPILVGSGWEFGPRGGMETVLLLVRRTPLDEGTQLGALLEPLPPPPQMRHREELVLFGLDRGADSVSTLLAKNRGDDDQALAADEPLHKLLIRLGEHFELIRAVRFSHEGE